MMNHFSSKTPDEKIPEFLETPANGTLALDDEQRIKVLSPGMLVFKRFITNRLAIVGSICIILMFLFAFSGGWLMPYGESQVFTHYVDMSKDYAAVTENKEFRYSIAEGKSFSSVAQANFVLAVNKGDLTFTAQNHAYSLEQLGENFYLIFDLIEAASAGTTAEGYLINLADDFQAPSGFEAAFSQAIGSGAVAFTIEDVEYAVVKQKKFYYAYARENLALAGLNAFDYNSQDTKADFEFQFQAELAILNGDRSFSTNGQNYSIEIEDSIAIISLVSGSEKTEYATLSRYIIQPVASDVFLTIEFKDAIKLAIADGKTTFLFTDNTGEMEYTIEAVERRNDQWVIRRIAETLVILSYEAPSSEHLLGTDGNGMDILTRMMYGGRISLMIGFIVVIIETLIGVILGGLAGYFGKWIDNLLMRLVDVFNSVPSIPLIIILGAMMDALKVDPQTRMIYLMLILGLLGWPYIARLVRGQILSLREQEFMVAAEATGLSVFRKIFRHLIPNVIPQLIVVSTMSLGGVILTESVLSFLGLGVKFPFASWGNIINAVTNVYVMTNYWFVWIPAGFCILVTVLGFNFIGDGLRDAFDPKMKR